MKKIKKHFGTGISSLLLLIFSVTVLPLDFFHSHSSEPVCISADAESTCRHKVHLSSKGKNFCWVCSVHYDKTFVSNPNGEISWLPPVLTLFTENPVTGHLIELLLTPLRGPPAE